MNTKLITNQAAADELKEILKWYSNTSMARGSAKSFLPVLIKLVALEHAIKLLESTPDEE